MLLEEGVLMAGGRKSGVCSGERLKERRNAIAFDPFDRHCILREYRNEVIRLFLENLESSTSGRLCNYSGGGDHLRD